MRRLSINDAIERCRSKHNDKYEYVEFDYKNCYSKLKIKCPEHGIFIQIYNDHVRGSGCPKCSRVERLSIDSFIDRSSILHKNFYDYSKVKYKGYETPVEIICPTHGSFFQKPHNHLSGKGCGLCGRLKTIKQNFKTHESFIIRANNIHKNKYSYDCDTYKHNKIKIKIFCQSHGYFFQSPKDHLNGCGCPSCNTSKGELIIKGFLEDHGIEYVEQKKFNDCKHKSNLRFDFYIKNKNTCIEYDGVQHFKPIEIFGGQSYFEEIKIKDEIKNKYCKSRGINLIRFRFDDDIDCIYKHLSELL